MTNLRRAGHFLLAAVLLLITSKPLSAAPSTENLVRVHWLGLKQVGTDTNAAQLMKVWQLPSTAALVAQTLDKLSRWPGHGETNAASTQFRPLLDDLIASEFYLELRVPTNSQFAIRDAQLCLALRLPADHAQLWQTNLAAASAALAGSCRCECSRSGDWTLVGVGLDKPVALTDFAARLSLPRRSAIHDWLEADFSILPTGGDGRDEAGQIWSLVTRHSSLSQIHLTLSGESGGVHTSGTLDFSRPLDMPLTPWEIPTNFIHAPLASFTAVRGIAPWLTALNAWQRLQLAPPPDQAYVWAQSGTPYQTYFAAPLPSASNQMAHLAARLVQNVNPWLAANADGHFQWHTNPPGIVWHGVVILSPFLNPVLVNQHDWLLGGVFSMSEGYTSLPPSETFRAVFGTPDLIYYQAEHAGQRVDQDLFITQLFRVIFQKATLSTAVNIWLNSIEPLLGYSTTSVTRTSAQQLAFARNSSIGLTALELNLLADWLDSPQFPRSLDTFLAPPDNQK
jgi:hypothetical protein